MVITSKLTIRLQSCHKLISYFFYAQPETECSLPSEYKLNEYYKHHFDFTKHLLFSLHLQVILYTKYIFEVQ